MFTDVSEMLAASIIRVMSLTLMMEAANTSETSVSFYQTTKLNNPEYSRVISFLERNTNTILQPVIF
jgi:hypothetical protein